MRNNQVNPVWFCQVKRTTVLQVYGGFLSVKTLVKKFSVSTTRITAATWHDHEEQQHARPRHSRPRHSRRRPRRQHRPSIRMLSSRSPAAGHASTTLTPINRRTSFAPRTVTATPKVCTPTSHSLTLYTDLFARCRSPRLLEEEEALQAHTADRCGRFTQRAI